MKKILVVGLLLVTACTEKAVEVRTPDSVTVAECKYLGGEVINGVAGPLCLIEDQIIPIKEKE